MTLIIAHAITGHTHTSKSTDYGPIKIICLKIIFDNGPMFMRGGYIMTGTENTKHGKHSTAWTD